jgi:uncharacterized membrane protein
LRKLAVLPVAFALMMAFVLPTGAFAAEEGLSNYNNKPSTTPTTPTTSTPATTPTSGTSPEKAESTPTKTTAPEEKAKEPAKTTTTTSEPAKASTLPFTGFDLRWTVAAGVLLLAMGFSIVVAQRRQGRKGER